MWSQLIQHHNIVLQLVDPPTKKGFSKHHLLLNAGNSLVVRKPKKNEWKYINFTLFRSNFREENLFVFSLYHLRFSPSVQFDCAKTETPFSLLPSSHGMAKKIYTETLTTSKNPTEWSFTWITFNNNPFSSSSFAPTRLSSSSFPRFLYQPTKYLFMALDSILCSSVLLYLKIFVSGTEGININKSCSLRSKGQNCPHLHPSNHFRIKSKSKLFTPFVAAANNTFQACCCCWLLLPHFFSLNSVFHFPLSSALSRHTTGTLLLLHCLNGSYILTI